MDQDLAFVALLVVLYGVFITGILSAFYFKLKEEHKKHLACMTTSAVIALVLLVIWAKL